MNGEPWRWSLLNTVVLIGPFPGGLDDKWGPEDESDFDISEVIEVYTLERPQLLRFATMRRVEEGFGIDHLERLFPGRSDQAILYIIGVIVALEVTEVSLTVRSDDGIVVWVNDVEVHRHDLCRRIDSEADDVGIVRLEKGVNLILLKVSNNEGEWGFSLNLEEIKMKEGVICEEER